MATVWAVNNGNWSNAATWSGSYIPQPGDDVFANNRTVNVDVNFDVASLRNTSGTGITAGGSFNFNSGSVSGSITGATPLFAGAVNLITVTHNTGDVSVTAINGFTLSSNISPVILDSCGAVFNFTIPTLVTNVANSGNRNIVNKTGNGTLNLNSNSSVVGGLDAVTGNRVLLVSAGSVVVTGTIQGPTGNFTNSNTVATIEQSSGNLKIIGNIPSATGGGSNIRVISFTGTTFELTGSITGGSNTLNGANLSATNINISGSVIGGSAVAGISVTSAATINIIGTITAGSGAPAVSLSGASTLIYSGSLASSANQPAIISSNAAATNIFTGPFINTNNTMAVQCADMVLTADASTSWNFGNITLFSPERLAFYPSASDIRQGTTYADGTVSGSLAMPPATAVIAGTPTDNTTGSAVLTPAQLQDAVWGRDLSQMTETGSIGNRLARVSTTGTTGAQIASYLL